MDYSQKFFKVFDDFIPDYHQRSIEKEMKSMSWSYNSNIANVVGLIDIENISENQSGFSGNIYSKDDAPNNEILIGLCIPIIQKAEDFLGEEFLVERIRAGMFFKTESSGMHMPHVDYYDPHVTVLYYVNDSDGDTVLFDKVAQDREYPQSLNPIASISPKRGRAVIFNGLIYHSSSVPVKNIERTAININLFPLT